MTKERTAIGPWLLVPVLTISALSHGLLNNPRFGVIVMGNNGFWAYPIAGICYVAPAMAIIYLLAKRFPNESLIEQGKRILGPALGTVTGLGYLGFLLLFLAMLTRDIIDFAGVYFLFRTPVYILVLVYLLSAAFLASRGIETITRTASIVVIPALLFIVILLAFALPNITPNNLKPVFTANILDYFIGAKGGMQTFYMLGLAAMVLPYLKPLHAFPRFAGGTILLLLILFTLFAIGSIGVFGPQFLLRFAYPNLEFFRIINQPSILLEQTGIIFGITLLVMILMGTSFGHYALSLGFSHVAPFFDYKIWVWILIPIKFIIAMLPPGVLETKMTVDFIARNGWIALFGYPFFLWILAVILRKKGANRLAD